MKAIPTLDEKDEDYELFHAISREKWIRIGVKGSRLEVVGQLGTASIARVHRDVHRTGGDQPPYGPRTCFTPIFEGKYHVFHQKVDLKGNF